MNPRRLNASNRRDPNLFLTQMAREGRKVTLVGSVVNLFLIVLKFVAGFLGNSQALIADAIHSLSDLFTDAVVLLGIKVGTKGADETHHFGHGRYETLASSVVGGSLIVVAFFIASGALSGILHQDKAHPTWLAVGAALISIILKEGLYRYTVSQGAAIKSAAVAANAWHHRSDALSSLAVLFGVAGARIRPEWHILDSYAALIVSIFILKVGFNILRASIREFTDTAPDAAVLKKIRECVREVPGVLDFHDLRVRTSRSLYHMEVHVVVDRNLKVAEGHRIAKEVEFCLAEEVEGIGRVIVHVDPSVGEERVDSPFS
jgi:cation diffusion facilitator family transporter